MSDDHETRKDSPRSRRATGKPPSSQGLGRPETPGSPTIDDLPTVDDDNYERGAEVARGGLGRISQARDLRLDRIVALKELALQHPHARARFTREVLLTARLAHPNIIPLHEAGRWHDGQPFYAMKLVEGSSLSDVLEEARDFEDRLHLLGHITDVAEAVAYAHSQKIIHRDIKPANVLVGPFGETMVIDWGLAKDLNDPTADDALPDRPVTTTGGLDTTDGAVLGTPAYMPPEQASGGDVDERSDVYALGALLYELLAGVRPYADLPPRKVLEAVTRRPPRPLAELAPDAPRDLIAIANKAMARKPEHRYPTAKEMAAELRRFQTGRLVGAHQYSTFELLARFARRARGVLVTTAIALTVLAVVGVLAFQRISDERDRAEDNARIARASERDEKQARALAERRVDQLVFARAVALLDSDPTMAVAELKRLREIPDGAASVAAEAEDRGVARRILTGHEDVVWSVVIVGDQVVSAGSDGVRIWREGQTAGDQLRGHTDRVQALAASPDGTRVATGSYDRTVRIWSLADRTSEELRGHGDRVKDVAFVGPSRVVSLDASGETRLWDLPSQRGEVLPATGTADGVLAADRGGRYLAASSPGNEITLWELPPSAPPRSRPLRGHAAEISALSFSGDGRRLVSASIDGEVWLWDLAAGSGRRLSSHPAPVLAVAATSDGSAVASADADGRVAITTAAGARRLLGSHRERVTMLAFAPDDQLLVSASWDQTARIWRRQTGDFRELRGHDDVVSWAAIDGASGRLATASWDKTVRLWSLEAPSRLTLGRHAGGVRSVSASPDGALVASAGRDNTVGFWRTDGSGGSREPGHRDVVYRVLFSPDGSRLASSSDDRDVRLWTVADRRSEVLAGHRADVEELAFSPDGSLLASASKDDTARLWTVATGDGRIASRHDGDVTWVGFSPNGELLATAGRDRLIRLVATDGGTTRELRGHHGEVWSAAFAGDDRLVSTGTDDTVRLWNLTTGDWTRLDRLLTGARPVRVAGDTIAVAGRSAIIWLCSWKRRDCRELLGHHGAVEDIALSGDGSLLASAGADNTVRLWNLTGSEQMVYRGHTATVFDVELTGDAVYSASADGRVIRWPLRRVRDKGELRAWLWQLTSAHASEPAAADPLP